AGAIHAEQLATEGESPKREAGGTEQHPPESDAGGGHEPVQPGREGSGGPPGGPGREREEVAREAARPPARGRRGVGHGVRREWVVRPARPRGPPATQHPRLPADPTIRARSGRTPSKRAGRPATRGRSGNPATVAGAGWGRARTRDRRSPARARS